MTLKNVVDIMKSSAFRNCRRYSSIEIPKRVKRDNLSILKALNSVAKPDYLAPQYRFIDDPFLIPYSSIDKREYTLSYLSGKNAARLVMEKYPKLFEYSTAHPKITDFMPTSDPSCPLDTIDGLKERISMKHPVLAYDSYMKLFEEGIEVPRAVMDDLLDLLCFTNHEAPSTPVGLLELYIQDELSQKPPEQRISGQEDVNADVENSENDNSSNQPNRAENWKVHGAAETLLSHMKEPTSRNVCSLIKGMVKFAAYKEAYAKYNEGLQQNVDFDVSTYNSIVCAINQLQISPAQCMKNIVELLKTMESKKVMPNVGTFNNVLMAVQDKKQFLDNAVTRMEDVLSEMSKCGIEPTLTTWFNVLNIVYQSRNVKDNILPIIIDKLSESGVTIKEMSDLEFFQKAMSICFINFKSVSLAKALNAMVIGNENVLGNSRNSTSYYSNYLVILGRFGSMEEFFEEYERLCPHVFTPSYKVLDTVLEVISVFGCYEQLPKLWSDITLMRFTKREELVERFFDVMGKVEADEKLQLAFVNVVDRAMKNFVESKSLKMGKYMPMSGGVLSNMISVYLNSNEVDKCWEAIKFWRGDQALVSSIPDEMSLMRSCQAFIKRNEYDRVHEVLGMITTYGHLCADELLEEALSSMTLDETQKTSLKLLA